MGEVLDDEILKKFFSCYVKGVDDKKKEWFEKCVRDTLWTIYYWQKGKQLLNAIINTAGLLSRLSIEYFEGACGYVDNQRLSWDPEFLQKGDPNQIIEPTQPVVVASKKEYVYLFHELVHYLHDLRHTFKKQGDQIEEFQTVGLYEFSNEECSENALRKEAKLPRRPCYYYRQGHPEETKRRNDRQLITDVKKIKLTDKECNFPYDDSLKPKGTLLWRQRGAGFAVRGAATRGARPLGSA